MALYQPQWQFGLQTYRALRFACNIEILPHQVRVCDLELLEDCTADSGVLAQFLLVQGLEGRGERLLAGRGGTTLKWAG